MRAFSKLALGMITATMLASPALAQGRWDRGPDHGYTRTEGKGWDKLDPWLRNSPDARRWVMRNFDRNGSLGKDEAKEANRAFQRFADRNRDGRLSNAEIRWGVANISRSGPNWRR